MNRTLVELARTILAASKLPELLWELAMEHVAYVRNFAFTRTRPDMTPYQAWYGIKPDVSHLRELPTSRNFKFLDRVTETPFHLWMR